MKNKKLNLIQLVRALAILFVLLGHLVLHFSINFNFNFLGIGTWERTGGLDLFFVISGFMIYYIYGKYIGDQSKMGVFLKKRILKIVPLYWAITAVAASIFFVFPHLGAEEDRNLLSILKSMLFLNSSPTLVVAWSLSYIMFFYVVFSLLIFKPKYTKVGIFAWFILIILNITNILNLKGVSPFLFNVNNLEIWAGVLVAYIVKNYDIRNEIVIMISGFSLFSILWINNTVNFINIEMYTVRPVLYCLASMLTIMGVASLDLKKNRKIPKLLTYLGDSSYSIYLTHGPFLQFYILVFIKINLVGFFGVAISMILIGLLTVISGIATYKFLEKPLNKVTSKLLMNTKAKSDLLRAG